MASYLVSSPWLLSHSLQCIWNTKDRISPLKCKLNPTLLFSYSFNTSTNPCSDLEGPLWSGPLWLLFPFHTLLHCFSDSLETLPPPGFKAHSSLCLECGFLSPPHNQLICFLQVLFQMSSSPCLPWSLQFHIDGSQLRLHVLITEDLEEMLIIWFHLQIFWFN